MPSPRRNLALLHITKFVTIRTPGLAVYFASLSTTSFHMGTPYKIQKIPRTPGCNNGPPVQGISRFYLRQHRTIPALRLKHRSGGCGTASALPKCSIISGCGTRIVLRGQKPLALCDRCPCFGSLFPPLAALTFAASSIICAFGLVAAAPRSPYRHLELCGIALYTNLFVRSKSDLSFCLPPLRRPPAVS